MCDDHSCRHLPVICEPSYENSLDRQISNGILAMRYEPLRPGERLLHESAQEFLTARDGFSYLRSAGRRRRGTILDTSAGYLQLHSIFLSVEGNEGKTERRIREREKGERAGFSGFPPPQPGGLL